MKDRSHHHRTIVVQAALCFIATAAQGQPLVITGDDTLITSDTLVSPGTYHVPDADNDGAVRIIGHGITVDFQGALLIGSAEGAAPDEYKGRGIVVRGSYVTLRNVKVRGYKVGIHASNCRGLVIEDVDVSENYRQRLKSTPQAEDSADWLYPHENDHDEWVENHGAALYVAGADRVTIRRLRARRGQNGIMLSRVDDSRIYDNDCSFLSGWGLAMWRCNRNAITRNAFDFCIRGYSHGVYNRGQDSAGILMFEQNNDNLIAENSATHCGDGLFGFGGNESLAGQKPTGNNRNRLIRNDFSYAAAHGIEMTFSLDNQFVENTLIGNAICGVWAGYSQSTRIFRNVFIDNGDAGYRLERGGVNIEHGCNNVIQHNRFENNKCGVHLWWDNDQHLLEKPWVKANHQGSAHNSIIHNTFRGDEVALHLRATTDTTFAENAMVDVGEELVADDPSRASLTTTASGATPPTIPQHQLHGRSRPVGSRRHLRGRQNIFMTEWGPYDFTETLLTPQRILCAESAAIHVLGPSGSFRVTRIDGDVTVAPMRGALPAKCAVSTAKTGLHSFAIWIEANGKTLSMSGLLLTADWTVAFFPWRPEDDPREHPDKWRDLIAGPPTAEVRTRSIDFKWGGSPADDIAADHFATVATTSIDLPAGAYTVDTVSDDGIRVWIDGQRVIDDWTWHPPKEHTATLTLSAGPHAIRIEHFEIDGYACLRFRIAPAP